MLNKSTLACLCLVGAGLQLVAALDLVEMNDANKNELNLHLSKALAGVQEAYQNEFKFEKVKDIRRFLDQCEYVNQVMSASADSAFKGLAQKIKAIMADPSISGPCSVTNDELSADFDDLDTGFKASNYDYLLTAVFNRMKHFSEQARANKNLETLVQTVLASKAKELTDALLDSATDDVALFLGEVEQNKSLLDFDTKHKRLCQVSLIEPICRLVRRSPRQAQAIARDFDDFAEFVGSNDEAKLKQYEEISGVTMGVLKANCAKMLKKKTFKPIELMRSYVSADLMDEQKVKQLLESNEELSSYESLYDLCKLVAV